MTIGACRVAAEDAAGYAERRIAEFERSTGMTRAEFREAWLACRLDHGDEVWVDWAAMMTFADLLESVRR